MAKREKFIKNGGILKLPMFAPADIIDLSYKRIEALPNRIRIMAVYLRESDGEWHYQAICETTGDNIVMSESFISERMANHQCNIYHIEPIKSLYASGYRWAGNYPDFIAEDKAKKLIPLDNIRDIKLHTAFDTTGGAITGCLGIWIRYTTVINNNGTITVMGTKGNEEIIIK